MALHWIEHPIRSFSGARAVRIVDRAGSDIAEHSHDWPILSLHILGRQTKIHETTEVIVDGPAAILHEAGAPHSNRVASPGLEQLDIEFDPDWLRVSLGAPQREAVRCWRGGRAGAASRALISAWRDSSRSEEDLRILTRSYFECALRSEQPRRPLWLDAARAFIAMALGPVQTNELARQLGLHPAWLAQAYRKVTGEGIQETAQRHRVERAVTMLRETPAPCAEVAVAAGFCDQSHMIRAFSQVLGRRPTEVRAEAE